FDRTARLWNLASATQIRSFQHTNTLRSVAISSDGQYGLTAALDNRARLWDLETGQLLHTYTGHTATVRSVSFSPDGTHILTGSDDGTARLWDAATEQT